jgi:hypothetical protein
MKLLSAAGCLLLLAGTIRAAPGPVYSRQVQPFFAHYCVGCHRGDEPEGGLNLETYKGLLAGGSRGAVLVPGKPDLSRLVGMVEGKRKPKMPPKKARQPKPEEVALLRAWVASGARDDGGAAGVTLPAIRPRTRVATPVAALAYADATVLAAGGRNEVLFLNPASGELIARLGGLNDRVTALAFAPGGKRLAVASSTSGIRHEVRLTAGAKAPMPGEVVLRHDDVIHAVAFSPDGKRLASGGYDRIIRLWDLESKKPSHVLKDHSDAVYALAFSPDGTLLASASADRAVKVWDVGTGARLYTLGESTDWVYAVSWSPEGRRLAAAGVDKSIRVWEVDHRGGKIAQSVFAHEDPVTRLVYSADGKTLFSLGEDRTLKAWDAARMVERRVFARQPDAVLALAVRPDGKQLALGRYDGALVLLDAEGKVTAQPLPLKQKPPGTADRFGVLREAEPNDSPRTGQKVTLPVTIVGSLGKAGDVDYFRFEAKPGQEVGVQVRKEGANAGWEPILRLVDPEGDVVAESGAGLLGHTCRKVGWYALGIRDREFHGGTGIGYRLDVGDVPVVTAVFPLGLQRGKETEVRLEGVHLGKARTVRVKVPADARPGSTRPLSFTTPRGAPLGLPGLVVGEFPEVVGPSAEAKLPVPGTANGRIAEAGATQTWRFFARKGERLLLEVTARRLGSPLDSFIEILDSYGRPLPRAALRCLAKTYVAFRDHDSAGSGIRIETWGELAVNDYLLVGGELLRIRELPRNPDDDCQFFSAAGQRLGFLGTTPTHHSQGSPMYKVAIHPPGTKFPRNGLPVVTLFWRNDDGGPGFGKDSRLVFDPPADGDYQVRVGDSRGEGGRAHAYRLTVRPPRPDFRLTGFSHPPALHKGTAVPVTLSVQRRDEFDGPIQVRLLNLPKGFAAPAAAIRPGERSIPVALYAEPGAAAPAKDFGLKVEARAAVGGKVVVRELTGTLPQLANAADIVTTTEQTEVTVKPGREVRLTVRVERRNGFAGRIPVDVLGLPHGVRVLDVGLNGILITPEERQRTFVIHCDDWVKPGSHPFVVTARREDRATQFAAKAVLLRVVANGK